MRRVLLTAVVALVVVSSGCVGLITGETVEFRANETSVSDSALDSTGYAVNNTSERSITRDVSFLGQERTIRIVNQLSRYTKNGTLADVADNETLANVTENETLANMTENETLANMTENETLANMTENETLANATENETLANATENETYGGENESLQQAIDNSSAGSTSIPGLARFVVVSSPGAEVLGQTLNPAAAWSNERILGEVADQTGQLNNVEKADTRTVESLGESRNVTEFSATTRIKGREVDVRVHVTSFEHEGDVIIAVGVHPEGMDEAENVDELLGGLEHDGN